MPKKPWNIIAACTSKGGIGLKGSLPWNLPDDLKYFNRVTSTVTHAEAKRNAVVMGRRTWESLPTKHRPLKSRLNVVVSTTLQETEQQSVKEVPFLDSGSTITLGQDAEYQWFKVVRSLSEARTFLDSDSTVGDVFIIGGVRLYSVLLEHPEWLYHVYITRIGVELPCDVYMPLVPEDYFKIVSVSPTRQFEDIPYDFVVYTFSQKDQNHTTGNDASLNDHATFSPDFPFGTSEIITPTPLCSPSVQFRHHEEFQYLDLINDIIHNGAETDDRTGVGTFTKFSLTMRFDLRRTFPLFTTKRVFWRGVVEELLWFIRGDTNANYLTEAGVKIWEKNGSREFLDNLGMTHREVGDLGPVYGFQWRHFGASYKDMHTNYDGCGVDQLNRCIDMLKTNPSDRRIILSAWNPKDLDIMALPPCHMFCQFHVANGELSCCMYQRSCDMGLGVPFNVASYSLLTVMMAQVCDLKPKEFVHCLGNAHVYRNHCDALKEQLRRIPRPFPILKVNPDVKDIDGFKLSDFSLLGYNPHAKISMEMAV